MKYLFLPMALGRRLMRMGGGLGDRTGLLVVILWGFPPLAPAFGAGFAILQQGTGPMGQGNAFVAQADDPAAVFFNPAGIVQLSGRQAYLGSTLIAPQVTYDGPEGAGEATVTRIHVPPHAYVTQQVSPRLFFGLGVFSPFGLSTSWKGDWEGRYLTTATSLKTQNINPNLAVRWGRLALSGGIDVLKADLTLKKKIPFALPDGTPLPDGAQELTGDDWGYGYNLGLLYRATDALSFGASYRGKIRLDFEDAEAEFDVPQALGAFFPDVHASGALTLPPSLTGGVAWSIDARLSLETDLTWTGWSTYDEIDIELDAPVGPPGRSTDRLVQPKKWRDVLAYRFGLRYRLSERHTLRAGYIFDASPVPGSTLEPQLPDADRRIYALGFDWQITPRMGLGVAYNYIHGEKREKDNRILSSPALPEPLRGANGDYQQETHSMGCSLSYRF